MMENAQDNTEKKDLIQLYGLLGLSLVLSSVPSIIAAGASLVALTLVLIVGYIIRANAEHESLSHNHATFIIRTIWIGSSLAVLTVALGSVYLFLEVDNAPLWPCFENLSDPLLILEIKNSQDFSNVLGACIDPYFKANFIVLLIAGAITVGPIILYFVARFVRGLMHALKTEKLEKPKAWL